MRQKHEEYIDEIYDKFGSAARFMELNVSSDLEYDAEFLEWHGCPEVVGTNGDLAGILIDEETIMLFDMVQEKIVDTDDKVLLAFVHGLRREREEKNLEKIMAQYHKLVCELLKRFNKTDNIDEKIEQRAAG